MSRATARPAPTAPSRSPASFPAVFAAWSGDRSRRSRGRANRVTSSKAPDRRADRGHALLEPGRVGPQVQDADPDHETPAQPGGGQEHALARVDPLEQPLVQAVERRALEALAHEPEREDR